MPTRTRCRSPLRRHRRPPRRGAARSVSPGYPRSPSAVRHAPSSGVRPRPSARRRPPSAPGSVRSSRPPLHGAPPVHSGASPGGWLLLAILLWRPTRRHTRTPSVCARRWCGGRVKCRPGSRESNGESRSEASSSQGRSRACRRGWSQRSDSIHRLWRQKDGTTSWSHSRRVSVGSAIATRHLGSTAGRPASSCSMKTTASQRLLLKAGRRSRPDNSRVTTRRPSSSFVRAR